MKGEKEIGLVTAEATKSKVFVKDFFSTVRNFLGKELIEYTEAMQECKNMAIERMIKKGNKRKYVLIAVAVYAGWAILDFIGVLYGNLA